MNYLDVHGLLMKEDSILQFILAGDPLFHDKKEKSIVEKGEWISQKDSQYIYILESGILAQLIICTSFLTKDNIILNKEFS
ncbi:MULTISPECIES: hypothetical protein [Listeriaceae]|uniref:Uncharacterized protein n=2 Tax=Listeria TaxID=1637 RepID=A0A841Z152_9LIST|nr:MULTISPECIES: hypothetical protein [Listeria]MBC1458573.1 hypothetical protein [Listeria newyorkensis]WAO22651.1 hypothetical protein OTR81_05100 [Listeria newyorkensis]